MSKTMVIAKPEQKGVVPAQRDTDLFKSRTEAMVGALMTNLSKAPSGGMTLMKALIEAGVPSPSGVLQASYAHTRNIEEMIKLETKLFEDAAVITCCTLDLGTASPRNYVNNGVKAVAEHAEDKSFVMPARSLTRLLVSALGKIKAIPISNDSYPGYMIYTDDLDPSSVDVKKLAIKKKFSLNRFTLASRMKLGEFEERGIQTQSSVIIRFTDIVWGWPIECVIGQRYHNTFILPPFMNVEVVKILEYKDLNLYVVDAKPSDSELLTKNPMAGAMQTTLPDGWIQTWDPRTGAQFYVNSTTGEKELECPEMPKNWTKYFDKESGNFFYYNKTTKAKQWEFPTLKSVPSDSGKWVWRPDTQAKRGCRYVCDGTCLRVVSSYRSDASFSVVVPCEITITSSAITQWKIEIVDYGGASPMILVGVAITSDNGDLIPSSETGAKGWFLNCTGTSLYGSEPIKCFNKPYAGLSSLARKSTIICEINTSEATLKFYINKEDYGEAFTGIPLNKFLVPCVCLTNGGDCVKLTPPGI